MALPLVVLKPRPAAIANRARKASAATIQGSAFLGSRVVAVADPIPAPQRWQNLAPGLTAAEHDGHVAPASGAPQAAQYRPDASAPQEGQVVVFSGEAAEVICSNYSGAGFHASSCSQGFTATNDYLLSAFGGPAIGCGLSLQCIRV